MKTNPKESWKTVPQLVNPKQVTVCPVKSLYSTGSEFVVGDLAGDTLFLQYTLGKNDLVMSSRLAQGSSQPASSWVAMTPGRDYNLGASRIVPGTPGSFVALSRPSVMAMNRSDQVKFRSWGLLASAALVTGCGVYTDQTTNPDTNHGTVLNKQDQEKKLRWGPAAPEPPIMPSPVPQLPEQTDSPINPGDGPKAEDRLIPSTGNPATPK